MRVPVYRPQQTAPFGGSAGRIDPGAIAASGAALARGAAQVSDMAGDYAEKLQKAQRAIALTKATSSATRQIDDMTLDLEQQNDWQTGPARFDVGMQRIREQHLEKIEDPAVRAEFEGHFDRAVETRRVSFKRKMVDAMQKDGEASLLELLDTQSRSAAAAPNDLARENAMSGAARSIAEFRDANLIDPVKAVHLFKRFKSDVDEASVRTLMTADPDAALMALNDNNRFQGLQPERRAILADQATRRSDTLVRQRIAADEKAERHAARQLKDQQERNAADLWEQLFKGTLTFDALTARKRDLNQPDFTALGNALRGIEGKDDPAVLAGLLPRLDKEDIATEAAQYLGQGRLKNETYVSLVTKNRAALKDDQPASPYKSGRELVNVTLQPPEVLGAGAAQDAARAAQAQALVEFDNWATANPRAGRQETIEEAQGIIRRYQVIAFERMAIGVGLPRAYRGARADMTTEALDGAEQETIRQLDAKALSAEQASQELRKIESWREILARRPPPAAPKGGTKK